MPGVGSRTAIHWRRDVHGHDFYASLPGGWMTVSQDEANPGFWTFRIHLDRFSGSVAQVDADSTDAKACMDKAEAAWMRMTP